MDAAALVVFILSSVFTVNNKWGQLKFVKMLNRQIKFQVASSFKHTKKMLKTIL